MTQTKTVNDLKNELVTAYESWWMDAAAKTIVGARLQDVFLAHLTDIARKNGHTDIVGDFLKQSSLPKRGA